MTTFEIAKNVLTKVRSNYFGIDVRLANVENELIVFNYEVPRLNIVNNYKFVLNEPFVKDNGLVKFISDCLLKHIFIDIIDYFRRGDKK